MKRFVTIVLILALVALLMLFLNSCKKAESVNPESPTSLATSVLKFKSIAGENTLEQNMYGIFDASQSYGNNPEMFWWDMGDGSGVQVTDIDKFAYKYDELDTYTVMLIVFDSLGNGAYAYLDIEVIEPGFKPAQVILYSVSGPDSSGQITYEIGADLSYCSNVPGDYYYGLFENPGFNLFPFEKIVEQQGQDYGIFTVVGYNKLLKWTYGKGFVRANISGSIHFDEEQDMLVSSLIDGDFLPLNQLSIFMPGDLDWDNVLRYSIDVDSYKAIFYVNTLEYCNELNWPWLKYSSNNEDWAKVQMQWIGGTGWSQISVGLENFVDSDGTIFLRFGGNIENDEVGQIEESQFYLDLYQSLALKNFADFENQ
ncbi:MAG: PKD domain-containing protein [Candidatus Pacebacteria bacterium]|nr:PKD domain-containing protein [Candidatus Paceibacterota bacterium]